MLNGNSQAGFSYLLLLAWLSVMAILLLRSQDYRQTVWRREQEAQLLFAGDQIRQAIRQYRTSPAGNGCFPAHFSQLLSDKRTTPPQPLLRQIYSAPFSPQGTWGMLYDTKQRWIGVYSKGVGKPLRQEGFSDDNREFKHAPSYASWKFSAEVDDNAPLPERCQP